MGSSLELGPVTMPASFIATDLASWLNEERLVFWVCLELLLVDDE